MTTPSGAQRLKVVGLLTPIRTAVGILHLLFPGALAPLLLGRGLSAGERRVVRALGIRQLAQAVASGRVPSPAMIGLGTEVDVVHAASLLGLAVLDRRHRRIAIVGASIAGLFAFGGAVGTRTSPSEVVRTPASVTPATSVPPGSLREQWADRLARILVPGYSPVNHQPWRPAVAKL